jgi:hybrid polyketide synthase/nonribosomal peptide synthetase ACE1
LTPGALVNSPPANLSNLSLPTLVDWGSGDAVPVRVQSVNSITRFDANKCYVLFGLTGDLGRSLVVWMGHHGARNVVLTSRRPDIDPRWLEECRAMGMRVEVFAK